MVAAETLTHMAATSNWSLSSLRDETLALMDRKNWPTNRLAAELGMLQSTVEKFLNGGAPSPRLRELLVSLMARQGIESPLTEPAPLRPRSAIAYLAEQPDKAEMALTPEQEAYVDEFTSPAFVGRQLAEMEAEAAAEDEARLIEVFRRIGFEFPGNMISEIRAAGVTLIAPPKPEPTYTLTFTTPLFDTLRALVETSKHRTPKEGELLDHIAILLSNATPDETERTHE